MERNNEEIFLQSNGSQQDGRLAIGLREGYIDVDEMTFEALLALANDIATQIVFVDSENKNNGTWDKLFCHNEVVIMAMITIIDSTKIQNEFECSSHTIEAQVDFVLTLFLKIELWQDKLLLNPSQVLYELKLKILSVIEKHLSTHLNLLLTLCEYLHIDNEIKRAHFSPLWQLNEMANIACFTEQGNVHNKLHAQLALCFATWNSSVTYLQKELPSYINRALLTSEQDPSIALFFVFFKLFSKAQYKLNEFTERHNSFYYEQLLQFIPLNGVPESVSLTATLGANVSKPYHLKKGEKLTCGVDRHYQDIIYQTTEALTISDAKVVQVNHLVLHHDPLISPEHELGYVTRLSSASASAEHHHQATPLFSPVVENNAPIGIAISADILSLQEGDRDISLSLNLAERLVITDVTARQFKKTLQQIGHASLLTLFEPIINQNEKLTEICHGVGGIHPLISALKTSQIESLKTCVLSQFYDQVHKTILITLLSLTKQQNSAYYLMGALFSRKVLHHAEWLDHDDLACICNTLKRTDDHKIKRLLRLLTQDKQRSFNELFQDMFLLSISTETGWKKINKYIIQPLDTNADSKGNYGFTFTIHLGQTFPAISLPETGLDCAGKALQSATLKITLKPQSAIFPYSLFCDLILKKIALSVEVTGISEVLAYNQHGRLDISKPFTPFGPQPSSHAYLIFSNHEMAYKNLSQVTLNINWAELPQIHGGFAQYYQQYPVNYNNDSFKVRLSTIRGGQWQHIKNGDEYRLFQSAQNTSKVLPFNRYEMPLLSVFSPLTRKSAHSVFDFNNQTRNGFFKMSVSAPESLFGHLQYPSLLTQTLLNNGKNKKQSPLPSIPYTPIISQLTLDYAADIAIELDQEQQENNVQILHIHPFGYEQFYPSSVARYDKLFPSYTQPGNLQIGIKATQLTGRITLFFHLDEKATGHLSTNGHSVPSPVQWHYLSNNQWLKLSSSQVLSDSTHQFLTSGIITLDIPCDISDQNTVLSAGLFWLSATTEKKLTHFGNYFSITTHGVNALRCSNHDIKTLKALHDPLRDNDNWTPLVDIPQLATLTQKRARFGGKIAEDKFDKRRISERLRHKNRALSAWDHERIVLEYFPDIEYVTCLANTRFGKTGKYPGYVLLVVRKKVKQCAHKYCDNYKVGADKIAQIKQFLATKCPSFIKLDVCAPEYEKVQVRCSVSIVDSGQQGLIMRRLNSDISNLLCPWNPLGLNKGLGEALNISQLESIIRKLDYLQFVTGFSVLHIVPSSNAELYQLNDSATSTKNSVQEDMTLTKNTHIVPHFPWRLLMPVVEHAIVTTRDIENITAQRTGISELQINHNFIIQAEQSHNKEGQNNG
ncbi:MAG: hypothetical protein V5786_07895 [Psychromonas sp.]